MKNSKTTISGYLILAATIFTVVAHFLSTGSISSADFAAIPSALAGIGLIAAADGGH